MRKLLFMFAMLVMCVVAYAADDTKFYINGNVEAKPGETIDLAISMKNAKPILGFQLKVAQTDGFEFCKFINEDGDEEYDTHLSDRKKSKHVLDLRPAKNQGEVVGLSIICFPSDGNTVLRGNDGEMVVVRLKVNENLAPGNYSIRIWNIAFTPEDMQEIRQAEFEVPITIYKEYNVNAISSNDVMGLVSGSGTYRDGANVTLNAMPTDGHHFVKWSNETTENPYSFVATSDVNLTAIFDVNSYKLVYKVDGVEYSSSEVAYGTSIEKEAEPSKTGYSFSGWSDIPETMPAHDVEVVGSFAVNQYTLTFNSNGGSDVASITQDFGSDIIAPSDPEREGYTFAGWDKTIPETMPAENMEFTAQWTVNSYKLVYKVDGVEYSSSEVAYGTSIEKETEPSKTGYSFSGWSDIPETMPAHDVEVVGSFAVNQYTLTFNSNGGSDVTSITQDFGSDITAPSDPEREGYTFAGWDKTIPETMPAENIEFTAQWTVNSYKLVYKVDGVEYSSSEVAYGTSIEKEAEPSKMGYSFSGWSDIPETMPAHDVEVVGSFAVNQYTLTFNSNGGSDVTSITQDFGSDITAPSDPEREGYTFAGWDKVIPETMPAENMEFTAQWTVNNYKLRYFVDGEEYKSYDIDYGEQIVKEEEPTKDGYKFSGWSEIPKTMPAHDVDIYGTFTIETSLNSVIGESDMVDVYDIYGRMIIKGVEPYKLSKLLKPGLYIINGKKIMIRK